MFLIRSFFVAGTPANRESIAFVRPPINRVLIPKITMKPKMFIILVTADGTGDSV
jgi:hypothetical protein